MNPIAEKGVIRARNRIQADNKRSVLLNVHCAGNYISVKGNGSVFAVDGDGYIRDSFCNIKGNNNYFTIAEHSKLSGKSNIRVFGNNNTVIIGKACNLTNISIYITGNNNKITIDENVSAVIAAFHMENDNNAIHIGKKTTIHGRDNNITEFVTDEGTSIVVKNDCMISNDVSFRTTDSHSVLNGKGERINPANDIEINNHVWIGMRSMIFKNTVIYDNCVVGAGSFCNKDYEKESCLIAGNPAKIVKENVNWSRDRL